MTTQEASEAINKMSEEVKKLNENLDFCREINEVRKSMQRCVDAVAKKTKVQENILLAIYESTNDTAAKILIKHHLGL